MGNTVGSFVEVNKKWQKKWIPVKQSLSLSEKQKSVLVGSLLGDGTLRVGQRAINANFKVEHGLVQKNYVFWKYSIFRPWVFTEPKLSYRYRDTGERYEKSWWFRTVRHPILTQFHRKFYTSERKIVPQDIVDDLDPLALTVWVMDDGGNSRNHIDISTYAFTLPEIQRLVAALQVKFGLSARYYRDRDKGHRMYFDIRNSKKLAALIESHVVPILRYKIRFQQ